jgi:Putative transposase of IS4/5 family (DUF4096)
LFRTVLSDAQWERIAPELPGKIGDPGRSGDDNRLFVEGVLWVVRTGAPLNVIQGLAETFCSLPVPIVIDHFGLADAAAGTNQALFSTLCDLLAEVGPGLLGQLPLVNRWHHC